MVIFHSYVSLPEGSIETYAFGLPPVVTYKLPAKTAWDVVPEEKAMFFSSSEGRKCSKCGVHKDICVYTCRITKFNGRFKVYGLFYVLSMQKSMEMF